MRTIPRDYNINISVAGGNRRGSFSGGNLSKTKTTLNSRTSNNGEEQTNINLSKVFSIGLAFNLAQKYGEIRGAYTEDRIQQRRFNQGMTFAKYGIGIALNPAVGLTYAVGDLAYRGIQYNIGIQKKNQEAQYYKRLSGNTANSGSRYRGDYS